MSGETWRYVWRKGVAPQLSTGHLEALARGLEQDDPRLIQGGTTTPPPLMCGADWPCEAGCLIAYPFAFEEDAGPEFQGTRQSVKTVGETEEFFARVCFQADQDLGEPAAVRYLLNWYDESPREEVRRKLPAEVRLALAERSKANAITRG